MGLFDGSNATNTTTQSVPDWAAPYFKGYLQQATDVSSLPYQQYTGQLVAGMTDPQLQALQGLQQRAMHGNPLMSAAQGALQGVAGGDGLGVAAAQNPYLQAANPYASADNPHLQQTIDAAAGDTVRNYNLAVRPQLDSMDARSGSFGNAGMQQMALESQRQLAQTLGNQAAGLRAADFNQRAQLAENATNRLYQGGQAAATAQNALYDAAANRQLQAAGMAPTFAANDYTDLSRLYGVGSALQTQQQQGLDAQYGQWQLAQQYPALQLQRMGQALGINYGTTANSTTNPGSPSAASSALSGAILGNMLGGSSGNGSTGSWIGALAGLLGNGG